MRAPDRLGASIRPRRTTKHLPKSALASTRPPARRCRSVARPRRGLGLFRQRPCTARLAISSAAEPVARLEPETQVEPAREAAEAATAAPTPADPAPSVLGQAVPALGITASDVVSQSTVNGGRGESQHELA